MTTPFGQVADEMNDAIGMAEQALASLGLGVSAKVELDPADLTQGYLAFAKKGNEWMLLWCHGQEEHPLASVSHRRRIKAALRLDALHDALLAAHEVSVAQIKEATALVLAFAGRIGCHG